MLERANGAAVSIKQDSWSTSGAHWSAGELEYIPRHIGHIEKLHLAGKTGVLEELINNLDQNCARLLKSFHIRNENHDSAEESAVVLSDKLFGGNAPKLRDLQLSGPFALSLTSPWLRNLTRLVLFNYG